MGRSPQVTKGSLGYLSSMYFSTSSQGHPQSFGAIAKAVRQLLPRRIRFAEHVVDMPEIEAIDASSNACQAVAVLQTYLTSKFAGKQRACFSDPDGRGFSGFMPPL